MKNFSILLIFSSLILLSNTCDVFVDYEDLPEEDKALLNAFNKGDTIRLKSTNSSNIIEVLISEKKGFYYTTEDTGLGQKIEYENGSVKFEQKNNYAGQVHIFAYSDSQAFYSFSIKFDKIKFYADINSIDDSTSYTKNQVMVDGIYIYNDVYVFDGGECFACKTNRRLYLNAEHGILKIENLETGNAYTLVR